MDLLKRALREPDACEMGPDEITIGGKKVSPKKTIKFKGTETKEYTFEQVLFYLLNKDKKYTVYMTLCRESGIGKIYYTDQKIIVEEIENFKETTAQAKIDGPDFRYIGFRDYNYLSDLCKKEGENRPTVYYVIVPQSVSSPVNLSNIEEFFEEGRCADGIKISEVEKVELSIDGHKLTAVDDVARFTSEDWKRVVCIFLDGTKWQVSRWNIKDVGEIFNTIPTFYFFRRGTPGSLYMKNYNAAGVEIHDGRVDRSSLGSIRERIRDCILGM
ncbi:Cdc73-like RNA polymerase II accessory factor [Encephalitozoon hellem ATCC 50504]|uniref:RNA polymerase II accessory factor n=1 Tax=Encephalitozoon hellem TaxID=27973 RepID=A0A9Q9FAR1_ENCHE|nr:Cdc73-like RNA polymerase II accessory factor [Encephalitozoon hellem ATCC 50504]AFM99069.1 Cdc73-like RNA polymerase II accessory factor [Encephalitozoon hellem ATCC 50504]UTX42475.1 RNA polymerase II accessory factor [Encephalitozoon hellem]WEL37921.1 RNA polymerase II accessory factor [Encephalitozoon hellem]|eukprot:XP_003888050.1 Cdc73-like RNA polymerase II accessory factor [Encephalitozoon hellem ATCC 50504]